MDWTDEKGRTWNTGDCYTLPDGYDWALLIMERSRWGLHATTAPIACAGGAVAWAVFQPSDVAAQRGQKMAAGAWVATPDEIVEVVSVPSSHATVGRRFYVMSTQVEVVRVVEASWWAARVAVRKVAN